MTHLLELLGRGLDQGVGETIAKYFRAVGGKSLAELRRTCRAHPDWPDVQLKLGLACLQVLRHAEAVEHLRQACRQKPDYLVARLALAAAYDE